MKNLSTETNTTSRNSITYTEDNNQSHIQRASNGAHQLTESSTNTHTFFQVTSTTLQQLSSYITNGLISVYRTLTFTAPSSAQFYEDLDNIRIPK